MISEFEVENFLSIGSAITLSFLATKDKTNEEEYVTVMPDGARLLKVAMIFGANGTGKSNILKALDFFLRVVIMRPADTDQWIEQRKFKFNLEIKNKPTKMTLTFYFRGKKHVLYISLDNGVIYEESLSVYNTSRATNIYTRTYRSKHAARINFNEKAIKLSQIDKNAINSNTHDNCSVLAAYYLSYQSKMVGECGLKELYEYFENTYAGRFSITESMVNHARDLMLKSFNKDTKAFLSDWMRNGSFLGLNNISIDASSEKNKLSFNYLYKGEDFGMSETEISSGARRFFGLGALIYEHLTSNCLIMIDGLDIGLHPKLRRYFLRSFLKSSQKYSQLIFTTNAYYILDREFIRRDTVWFTEKSQEFETWLVRLSDCNIRKDVLVHKAYKEGKIVKLPIIGETLFDLTKYDIVDDDNKDK